MKIRTQLKAGGNEVMTMRASTTILNHNETLTVRSTEKAGGTTIQHNEVLRVHSALKAGVRSDGGGCTVGR